MSERERTGTGASRRDFLKLGAFAAAASAVGAASGAATPRNGLPCWANRAIDSAVARYRKWKGADETVTFVFTTDVHSYSETVSNPPDYSDAKMHVPLAFHCADLVGADFCADLGDLEFDAASKKSAAVLDAKIAATVELYSPCVAKRPMLFCVGNHDHGWAGRVEGQQLPVTNARFGDALNLLSANAGHAMTFGTDRSYGYCDLADKKTRVFFLNTSDGEMYYGMSMEQVSFVLNGLKTLPSGWQTLMLCHFCVYVPIGCAVDSRYTGCRNSRIVMQMVEDFVWRSKGGAEGLSWDFTQADGYFAGFFCGDSHFDNEVDLNYVPYTLSQGYGGGDREKRAYGGRYVLFDRKRDCLFELVAFKPATREAHVFRVGAGGEAYDRKYWYGRAGIEKCGGKRW